MSTRNRDPLGILAKQRRFKGSKSNSCYLLGKRKINSLSEEQEDRRAEIATTNLVIPRQKFATDLVLQKYWPLELSDNFNHLDTLRRNAIYFLFQRLGSPDENCWDEDDIIGEISRRLFIEMKSRQVVIDTCRNILKEFSLGFEYSPNSGYKQSGRVGIIKLIFDANGCNVSGEAQRSGHRARRINGNGMCKSRLQTRDRKVSLCSRPVHPDAVGCLTRIYDKADSLYIQAAIDAARVTSLEDELVGE
jgi:hypothetical protein